MPSRLRNAEARKRVRDRSLLPGYEVTYVTKNEISDTDLGKISDKIERVVSEYGGKTHLTEDWGRKKLSYPIKKETRGRYTYRVFTGKPEIVAELERNLRLQENVLRFLTVKVQDNFDPEIDLVKPSIMMIPKENREYRDYRGDREERGGYRDRDDRGYRGDRDY